MPRNIPNKCPSCEAHVDSSLSLGRAGRLRMVYECGSVFDSCAGFVQDDKCRIAELEAALADRKKEHEAWEAIRNGLVDTVYLDRIRSRELGTTVYRATRACAEEGRYHEIAQLSQSEDPVAAVLAAKAAEEAK